MEEGLLWYDNDPKARVEDKIRRAATRYQEKYGVAPNLCMLNPKNLAAEPASGDTFDLKLDTLAIKVKSAHNILPHHFWVGIAMANG